MPTWAHVPALSFVSTTRLTNMGPASVPASGSLVDVKTSKLDGSFGSSVMSITSCFSSGAGARPHEQPLSWLTASPSKGTVTTSVPSPMEASGGSNVPMVPTISSQVQRQLFPASYDCTNPNVARTTKCSGWAGSTTS